MATQNYTVSSHSHAAESSAFSLVDEKNKEKGRKELAHLSSLLALLEEEIAQAKSGGSTTGAFEKAAVGEKANGSGKVVEFKTDAQEKQSFEDSMAKMALALQLLQVKIAQFGNEKANLDNEISRAQVQMAQNNLKEVENQIKKIQAQEEKQKQASFWEKFAEIFLAVVVDIVAVCTLNPATAAVLIAISTAMLVASLTGALNKLTDAVSKLLVSMGVPEQAAHIIAAVVLTAVLVAIALASGNEAGAAEEIAEATAEGAEGAAEGAEGAAEGANSLLQNIGSKLAAPFRLLAKVFKALPRNVQFALLAGSFGASQTGMIGDIATGLAQVFYPHDKKAKEKMEQILEAVLAVITAVVAAGAGGAAMESLSSVGEVTEAGQMIPELGEAVEEESSFQAFGRQAASFARERLVNLMNFARSSAGSTTFMVMQAAGSLGESIATMALGLFLQNQGYLEIELAQSNARLHLINAAENMSSNQIKTDQKFEADALKSQSTGDLSLTKLMAGEAAFANLFTQNSPV